MAYNMGVHTVITRFPKFTQLVKERNWRAILDRKEYERSGLASRNSVVKEWFEEAVAQEAAQQKSSNKKTEPAVR